MQPLGDGQLDVVEFGLETRIFGLKNSIFAKEHIQAGLGGIQSIIKTGYSSLKDANVLIVSEISVNHG